MESANLRSGKGAIYVNAAGNDWHESKSGSTYWCGPNYGTSDTVRDEEFPCWDANLDSNICNASDYRSRVFECGRCKSLITQPPVQVFGCLVSAARQAEIQTILVVFMSAVISPQS